MQSVTIGPNQAGQRFDKFLHKYLPEASTGFLYKMLRKKNITLNGKKAEGSEMLKEGDEVKMFFADETFAKFAGASYAGASVPCAGASVPYAGASASVKESGSTAPKNSVYTTAFKSLKGITVLYEDEHALILNKPAGILTQKASDKDLSLNEWMIGYLLNNGSITEKELHSFKPSVCNRLDRNTSGLVLCGKSLAGSQALSKLIHDREIKKFYRTIVGGMINRPELIEGYLVKNEKTNTVSISKTAIGNKTSPDKASEIKTAYRPLCSSRVLTRPKAAAVTNAVAVTYLEVELITGKTHQIRAHLASIGHPLLGDYKYGKKTLNEAFRAGYGLDSQLLHACRLEFPEMKGALAGLNSRTIEAPLPKLFTHILNDCSLNQD